MSEHINDPIAEPVRELLTLFKEQFSAISFPDVSYAILEESVQKVTQSAAKLEEVRTQIEAAEEALSSGTEELQQKCSKALAYAKVYAEGNDELMERLAAIQLGRAGKAPKRGGAGESPKKDGAAAPSERKKRASAATEKSEEPAAE